MGILHEKLDELKASIGKAFDFADPVKYIEEKELEFKRHLADAVHGLEERITALEQDIVSLFQHPSTQIPAVQSAVIQAQTAAPAAVIEPVALPIADPAAPVATLNVIQDNALAAAPADTSAPAADPTASTEPAAVVVTTTTAAQQPE